MDIAATADTKLGVNAALHESVHSGCIHLVGWHGYV